MASSKSADSTPKSGGKGGIVSPAHGGITSKPSGAKMKLTTPRSASSKR